MGFPSRRACHSTYTRNAMTSWAIPAFTPGEMRSTRVSSPDPGAGAAENRHRVPGSGASSDAASTELSPWSRKSLTNTAARRWRPPSPPRDLHHNVRRLAVAEAARRRPVGQRNAADPGSTRSTSSRARRRSRHDRSCPRRGRGPPSFRHLRRECRRRVGDHERAAVDHPVLEARRPLLAEAALGAEGHLVRVRGPAAHSLAPSSSREEHETSGTEVSVDEGSRPSSPGPPASRASREGPRRAPLNAPAKAVRASARRPRDPAPSVLTAQPAGRLAPRPRPPVGGTVGPPPRPSSGRRTTPARTARWHRRRPGCGRRQGRPRRYSPSYVRRCPRPARPDQVGDEGSVPAGALLSSFGFVRPLHGSPVGGLSAPVDAPLPGSA